jgi:hypothetical protein
VERERSAAAAMLGLPGFVVLAVSDYAGELEQAIETTADVVGCPECGPVAQLPDRRPTWVRDLPSGGRPVMLVWVKRVWRCGHPRCPKRTWTSNQRGDRAAGIVDRAGPCRDLPPGWRGGGLGRGRGPGVWHWVGHRHGCRARTRQTAGGRFDPAGWC